MKKIYYLVLLSFIFLGGCTKSYLDINQNPNSPTTESVTPDLLLPTALTRTAAQVGSSYAVLARWTGRWTRGGDYGPTSEEESYNITTTFGNGTWAFWYDNLYDYDVMEKKANASGQKFYEAIAKTMKTVGFQNLVDIFNNVPYSKAFDLVGNITPAYDKGADIYADLFLQLDKALVLLDGVVPGKDVNIAKADIMFKGNITKWKKFINTQRLKLVVHLSQVSSFNHAAELSKITAEGFLQSGETAAVNPGYAKAKNTAGISQQNPFWDTYKADIAGVANDKYNRANNFVLKLYRDNLDIRYQYVFDPAAKPLSGNTYFGYDYGFVDPNPNNPKSENSSGVGGPGLARSFSQDQWLFTSVESKFLQAEAIQRTWLSGNAKTAYEDAVRESFIYLGVTNAVATANTYLATPFADWNAAGNSDKIKLIIVQKYLGLVGLNNLEGWTDYRRTGFPAIPKSLSPSVGPNIPLRYRYPKTEYDYNPNNVAAQNDPNPFTSGIFWDL